MALEVPCYLCMDLPKESIDVVLSKASFLHICIKRMRHSCNHQDDQIFWIFKLLSCIVTLTDFGNNTTLNTVNTVYSITISHLHSGGEKTHREIEDHKDEYTCNIKWTCEDSDRGRQCLKWH